MRGRYYQTGVKLAAGAYGLRDFGADVKSTLVGSPSLYYKQLRSGSLLKPSGLLRESLAPPTAVGRALTWGLPALGLAGAASVPPEYRGSAVGGVVGSAVGGALGAPLGVIGGVAGGSLLGALGKHVGSFFDRKPVYSPPGQPGPEQPVI